MSIQDWLITAGVLVMIVIVADGIRRMRNRGRLKLDIDKEFEDLPETDLSAELPNGGARPAGQSAANGDADVDLLLDDGLKGVGQGADDWTQPKAKQPVFKHQSHSPLEAPKNEPVLASSSSSTVAEAQAEPAVTAAEMDQRVEPAFSNDEIDLLQDEPLEEVTRERLVAEDSDGLDDGILGPVRVRKVVTPVGGESSSVDGNGVQQEAEADAEQSAPAFSVVEPELTKDDFDFNKPITELMADRIPMPASSEAPQDEPESSQQAEQPAALEESEMAQPSLGSAGEAEKPAAVAEMDMPLIAEPREPVADKPAEPKPRKGRKGKKPSRIQRWKEEIQTSFFDIDPGLEPEQPEPKEPELQEPGVADRKSVEKKPADSKRGEPVATEPTDNSEPQVLVMNVTAADEFQGNALFKLVEACGMEFGEMQIYHRYENGPGQGAIQFSMVNGVQPGHFNPAERDSFSTPALSFFLQMGEPKDLMQAFECMLATAQCVADNLDGEVKDENRSVMRAQTIEHYRQQVRDFERRRLARRA